MVRVSKAFQGMSLTKLARFGRSSKGSINILYALSLPVVMGITGLAVDVTGWYLAKREAQTAADAGALAGAYALYQTSSSSTAATAARSAATANEFTDGTNNQTVVPSVPPSSGAYTGDATAVEVTVTEVQPSFFAGLVFSGTTTVRARGVASAQILPGEYCVVALNESADRTINIGGNPLVNVGCGVASNSPSEEAVYAGGSSSLIASPVAAVGQVTGESHITGEVKNWQLPASDPYGPNGRDLQVPLYSGCDVSGGNLNYSSATNFAPSVAGGIFVFCANGVSLKSSHDFADGIYIFDGTDLLINASANVTGDNVTFIFTGSGSDYATIDIRGGSVIDMSATNYDTTAAFGYNYQGILFYQDQNAPNQTNSNKFNGGSSMSIAGAIYFPQQELEFNGNNSVGAKCLQIIADTITFSGSSAMGNACPPGIDIDPVAIKEVVLVE